jgi:hypothetical protein
MMCGIEEGAQVGAATGYLVRCGPLKVEEDWTLVVRLAEDGSGEVFDEATGEKVLS